MGADMLRLVLICTVFALAAACANAEPALVRIESGLLSPADGRPWPSPIGLRGAPIGYVVDGNSRRGTAWTSTRSSAG
jgi:hypothetical protein